MEAGRPREKHVLHFEAPQIAAAGDSLAFRVADDLHPVRVHTASTLARARRENPFLGLYSDDRLTHYVEADLPSDAIALMYVTRTITVDGFPCEATTAMAIHIPREGRCAEAAEAMRKNPEEVHPKFAWLAKERGDPSLAALAMQRPDLLADVIDPFTTAAALLYEHPGLINLSVERGGTIPAVILRQCIERALNARDTIVDYITGLGPEWCSHVRLKDGGEFVDDEHGQPFFTMQLHDSVRLALPDPLALALKESQQLTELQGQSWTVQYGNTSEEVPEAMMRQDRPSPVTQTKWTKKAHSSEWGVSFGRIEYAEPAQGGWSLEELWSSDSKPRPLDEEFVGALFSGTAFIRIDVETDPPRDDRATLPAQPDQADTVATFRANLPGFVAELSLDPLRTDLSVRVTRDPSATRKLLRVHLGIGTDNICWSSSGPRESRGELRITARNERLRHLSAYAEFFDSNDVAIRPGTLTPLPESVSHSFDGHLTKRYFDCIGPISMVFGAPLPADPVTLRIPFPENAAKMRLYWGGFGTGKYDAAVCPFGITATAVFELALPVYLLTAGAAIMDTRFVKQLLADRRALYSIVAVASGLSGGYIGTSQNPGKAAIQVAIKIGPIVAKALAKKGAEKFALWIARKIGEGAMRRAIPFVNAAFAVFDGAVTFAQLGQTIAAIVQSPSYYDFEITRSFDLEVTINPDSRTGEWPILRDRMRVQVVYDSGGELRHFETTDLRSMPRPYVRTFHDSPAAGRMKVFVFFYANNGWQSGSGSTRWFDAKGEDGTSLRKVDVEILNEEIPLSPESVYVHERSIVFEENEHRWKDGPAPKATTSGPGEVLKLCGITIAQRPGMIGYAWQATGLRLPRDPGGSPVDNAMYAVQNLSLRVDPPSRHAITPVGFIRQSGVAYELGSADDGSGMSFFLDPSHGDLERSAAGGHHLRRIALSSDQTPRLEVLNGRSWGRFPEAIDSFVYTQGCVVGVTDAASKLYILRLPQEPGPDAQATVASLASGEGRRDGLLSRPRAIAVALDGRLLVLEDGNRRVQCFDLTGNPVPYFKSPNGGTKSPVLPLRHAPPTRFLDLAVEAKGYLFVLSADGDGEDDRVDIYEPDGTFLVTTTGVAAGKIAVDLLRRMVTLNRATLRGPDGRVEPSVSVWLPPPPDPTGESS